MVALSIQLFVGDGGRAVRLSAVSAVWTSSLLRAQDLWHAFACSRSERCVFGLVCVQSMRSDPAVEYCLCRVLATNADHTRSERVTALVKCASAAGSSARCERARVCPSSSPPHCSVSAVVGSFVPAPPRRAYRDTMPSTASQAITAAALVVLKARVTAARTAKTMTTLLDVAEARRRYGLALFVEQPLGQAWLTELNRAREEFAAVKTKLDGAKPPSGDAKLLLNAVVGMAECAQGVGQILDERGSSADATAYLLSAMKSWTTAANLGVAHSSATRNWASQAEHASQYAQNAREVAALAHHIHVQRGAPAEHVSRAAMRLKATEQEHKLHRHYADHGQRHGQPLNSLILVQTDMPRFERAIQLAHQHRQAAQHWLTAGHPTLAWPQIELSVQILTRADTDLDEYRARLADGTSEDKHADMLDDKLRSDTAWTHALTAQAHEQIAGSLVVDDRGAEASVRYNQAATEAMEAAATWLKVCDELEDPDKSHDAAELTSARIAAYKIARVAVWTARTSRTHIPNVGTLLDMAEATLEDKRQMAGKRLVAAEEQGKPQPVGCPPLPIEPEVGVPTERARLTPAGPEVTQSCRRPCTYLA